MARRSSSRGSSAFGRGRSPSPSARRAPSPPAAPQRSVAPQPASQVAPQPTMGAAPGGGMMANIATTAAGVAIGHTIGHAITGSMMGGHGDNQPAPQAEGQAMPMQQQQSQQPGGYQMQPEPCKFELEQFLNCAQTQTNDLSLCDGFNQVLKECKVRYGGQNNAHMY